MPRTAERGGPQTRAKILAVANRMFTERGYDSVTVAQVAREAGVSSVTVFKHFPRKEDLFLDRAVDAVEVLQAAVRDRPPGVDLLSSLQHNAFRLFDDRHPLSGVNDRSVPFFRTVAASPALIARARQIAADLERTLAEEIGRDPAGDDAMFLPAFFLAGYRTVMVDSARRLLAGEVMDAVVGDHRVRLEALFEALRNGVGVSRQPVTDRGDD